MTSRKYAFVFLGGIAMACLLKLFGGQHVELEKVATGFWGAIYEGALLGQMSVFAMLLYHFGWRRSITDSSIVFYLMSGMLTVSPLIQFSSGYPPFWVAVCCPTALAILVTCYRFLYRYHFRPVVTK